MTVYIGYPGNAAERFDRKYYLLHHLPLVMKCWKQYGLESLAAFFPEGDGAGSIALCLCVFQDEAAVTASFDSPEAQTVMEDIKHFTDSTPVQSRSVPLLMNSGRRTPVTHVIGNNSTGGKTARKFFWEARPPRTSRHGEFWVPGERMTRNGKTYQRGPMYVAWEAPEVVTQPYPIVLVHGGALQGTEWRDTPDGRPGWAQRLVESGYAVLVIDRPGHGRSPYNPDVLGPMGPQFPYEEGEQVFFSPEVTEKHTQWLFDTNDAAKLDEYIAPFGPLPADIAAWQQMDADRLAQLLDRIGPAILMTHSASGSDGWLVADRRPHLVMAIVTVEPMGPAFADTPNIGALSWGLTAAPISYDPPLNSADEVRAAEPSSLRIPALAGKPVAVVSGEVSAQSKYAPKIREFLINAGADAYLLHLPDYGIHGNGHGLIYEKNSDAALQPVLRWLQEHVHRAADSSGRENA